MQLSTETISGTECEIHVTPSGQFIVRAGGGESLGHSSDTLDKAKAEARKTLAKRKVRVEVPYRTADGRPGVAYGLHAGTGNVLAREQRKRGGEESLQLSTYNDRTQFKADTPDEVLTELNQLAQQIRMAQSREQQLEREWQVDLSEAVRLAVNEAAQAAAEAESR